MMEENKIILYKDKEGKVNVNVRFADEDVWLTREHLAEIYATTPQNNLDMIIALGYRVQSPIAVRFRRWATQRLHEYIQKGFTMDDERLKQGGNRYFKELLQRIRDIRSSERNFYQQVTDIYATSTDYDPRAKMTKLFFATVQNKMHYAVHEHTAAELIYERVDNEKPFVGMTNFKGNSLDDQILRLRRNILEGAGTVSHQEAIEKAEREFEIYREREMRLLESDFDKAVKRLKNLQKGDDEEKEEGV